MQCHLPTLVAGLCAACVVLAVASPARAWLGPPPSFVGDKFTTFDDRAWPDGAVVDVRVVSDADWQVDPGRVDAALQRAVASWAAVGCARLRWQPPISAAEADGAEGQVLVVPRGASVQGQPLLAWTTDELDGAVRLRATIHLNDRDFAWSMGSCAEDPDLEGVLAHELGHVLGLGHSDVPDAIMRNPVAPEDTWTLRVPRDDDRAGACAVSACDACAALEPTPGGAVCAACRSDADCLSGDARCVVVVDGAEGFCAPRCAGAGTCAADDVCTLAVADDGRCAPVCLAVDAACDPTSSGGDRRRRGCAVGASGRSAPAGLADPADPGGPVGAVALLALWGALRSGGAGARGRVVRRVG